MFPRSGNSDRRERLYRLHDRFRRVRAPHASSGVYTTVGRDVNDRIRSGTTRYSLYAQDIYGHSRPVRREVPYANYMAARRGVSNAQWSRSFRRFHYRNSQLRNGREMSHIVNNINSFLG